MTERTLLLRCASAGRHFIVGTDFPSARVFDTATSGLVCVVDLPTRSRTSLAALSLTSVALGAVSGTSTIRKKKSSATLDDDALDCHYAAVGLSNGTVLLHSVTRDEAVGHIAVSETQHAIIAMTFCGSFLFCLAANSVVYVLDVERTAMGVRMSCRVQPDASAIAAVAMDAAGAGHSTKASTTDDVGTILSFRVMVAGPTNAVYIARLHRASSATAAATIAATSSRRGVSASEGKDAHCRMEKEVTFASQGSSVDFLWVSKRAGAASEGVTTTGAASSSSAIPAVTSNAQEGVIHVWDIRSTGARTEAAAAASVSRCRRTLICGQRIANLSVFEGDAGNTEEGGIKTTDAARMRSGGAYVMATTFTGAVLLWDLGDVFVPRIAELVPQAPTMALISASPVGRILYAAILPASSSAGSVEFLSVQLLRGRFALPHFEAVTIAEVMEVGQTRTKQQRRAAAALLSLGFTSNTSSQKDNAFNVLEVPLSSAYQEELERQRTVMAAGEQKTTDGAATAFSAMDTVWATHQRTVAARALVTPTESFAAARTYHAASMKDLPVKQLTLEQRLRKLEQDAMAASSAVAAGVSAGIDGEDEQDEMGKTATQFSHSTALATVPLYQALHANDISTVMELLALVDRSKENMRATILSLQLPYCMQLMQVLSERLGISSAKHTKGVHSNAAAVVGGGVTAISCRSPLLEWFDAIVQYRGMEMYAAQREADAKKEAAQKVAGGEEEEAAAKADVAAIMGEDASPPKDFIAPVLHQYRNLCSQYDKLAALYGRMSIFSAVRPSEKNSFVNRRRKVLSSNMEAGRTPATVSGKADFGVLQDDILFPAMFTECRTRAGPHVIRVKSKLAIETKHHRLATSDRALLRRAKQMAKRTNGEVDDDDNESDMMDEMMVEQAAQNGADVDFDALEQMNLNDSDSEEDEDDASEEGESDQLEDSEEESDAEDGAGKSKKKARRETEELLADDAALDGSEEDGDAHLDSSDAEFSEGSDDEVHSDVLDFSGEEDGSDEESSDDDDEEEDEDSIAGGQGHGRGGNDDDDDENFNGGDGDDEDDDGMGEDMQDLLAENEDEDDRIERRKSKRVRTD